MSEFTELLEQEIPKLRRYARALTRDVEDADDLVQSCLVRALAKQHLWQPGTNLRAWLFTIMHNLRISDIRRSAHERDGAAAIAALRVSQSNPGECLELLDLDRAMAKLPERQRQVILLIGLEGMRYDQVAAIFAVPVGTIRSRIGRARAALRKLMYAEADCTNPHSQQVPPEPVAAAVRGASLNWTFADTCVTSRIRQGHRPPSHFNTERQSPATSSPRGRRGALAMIR